MSCTRQAAVSTGQKGHLETSKGPLPGLQGGSCTPPLGSAGAPAPSSDPYASLQPHRVDLGPPPAGCVPCLFQGATFLTDLHISGISKVLVKTSHSHLRFLGLMWNIVSPSDMSREKFFHSAKFKKKMKLGVFFFLTQKCKSCKEESFLF